MSHFVTALWPFALMAVALGVIYIAVRSNRWLLERGRRHPFSADLNRFPGQSLGKEVDDLFLEVSASFAVAISLPFLVFWSYTFSVARGHGFSAVVLNGITFILMLTWIVYRLSRDTRRLRNVRLGMWGEMATGQLLDALMLDGCRVFHDLPAERFNIDHVVVTDRHILAVETKARRKPEKGRGKLDYSVEFDGSALHFPDWTDKKSVEQALRQSQWLQKWLRDATGDQVNVIPVLAIPGWYITRTRKSKLYVMNPRQARELVRGLPGGPLDVGVRQRVIHQLEQRCRHAPWEEAATQHS